jgi:hypothetical protein
MPVVAKPYKEEGLTRGIRIGISYLAIGGCSSDIVRRSDEFSPSPLWGGVGEGLLLRGCH